MSSTDREARLAAFFEAHLKPAAAALAARGVPALEPGPDAAAESYWHVRTDPGDTLVAIDFEHLDAALAALWAETPEFAALAGPLVALAREVQDTQQTAEVDAFVYQMF
jgi:hypothetical protein